LSPSACAVNTQRVESVRCERATGEDLTELAHAVQPSGRGSHDREQEVPMTLRRFVTLHLIAAAALAWGAAASAQETTAPVGGEPQAAPPPPPAACPPGEAQYAPAPPPQYAPEAPPPQPYAHRHRRHHNVVFAPEEISLTTGAGVTNYFGSDMPREGVTDVGAAWDARLTFGTRSVFALEAGYVGSVNNFDVPSERSGQIIGNGLDGDLRLQIPTVVEPYVFGGVGYNHMALQNTPTIQGPTSDDQLTVPAGGGVTAYLGRHATVDLRGTYRYTPDNNIAVMNQGNLHQWVAQAHLGYQF
jgi:hypothetical protein